MTARDLALLLLQAPVDLEVEINGESIHSIAVFGGKLNIDSDEIFVDDADLVLFNACADPDQ